MHTERMENESAVAGSRRGFFTKLAGIAAASGFQSTPVDASEPSVMPAIQLGKHQISRLIAGANPINGYSYSGPHGDRQMKEYFTTGRTVEFLRNCERAGMTTHQFSNPDRSADYIRLMREGGSKLNYICLHNERTKIKDAVALTHPIAMAHHGGVTDQLFADGKAGQVHDYVKAVHDCGLLAAVSAHNPDCIKRVADEGWEVDFFMTCFYFLSRKKVNKDASIPMLDFGMPFFQDDPKAMTQVIRQVKQPCLGFKILGAGRHCANQQTVRAAFKYAFENIKPIDGVIVGMFPWSFDEVTANAQITREIGRAG